ncbi:hypothetical protein ACFSTC_57850 [Nonomuraea ferruginea]
MLDGAEQQAKAAVSLGLNLVGAALALTGQVARVPRLSDAVPSFAALADEIPRVRLELERRLGASATDAILGTTRIVANALAARPVTLLVDSAAAAGRYAAAHTGRRAWERRETALVYHDGSYRHIRTEESERPAPLPRGPLERYADLAGPGALAAHGVTTFLTRDHRRGLPCSSPARPRLRRLARDGYVSAIMAALAGRDAMVLDRRALSRMDRVDTVVFDAAVLTSGRWAIESVLPPRTRRGPGRAARLPLHAARPHRPGRAARAGRLDRRPQPAWTSPARSGSTRASAPSPSRRTARRSRWSGWPGSRIRWPRRWSPRPGAPAP